MEVGRDGPPNQHPRNGTALAVPLGSATTPTAAVLFVSTGSSALHPLTPC